jgi:hypothetical protein
MYASACIYMCCCNTKRNIMKYQAGRPDLGSRGKSLCLSVLWFMLSLLFIFCYKIHVSELFRLQGDAFAAEGFLLGPEVDPVQWEICGIDSCGERRWRAAER